MKPNLLLRLGIVSFSCLLPLRASEPDLREQLRDALYTEEVTRDPEKAAKQYEEILARHDEQQAFAASALFRLAEVRRKQNRKDDAIALYQRLIAEFPKADAETRLAKENLTALGGKMPETEMKPASVNEEDKELARLEAEAKSSPDMLLDSFTFELAARNGHAKIVKRMLAAGCKPFERDALRYAAEGGNLEIVKLLTSQPDPVPETNATEAIWRSIDSERLTVLDFLLEKGLKPGKVPTGNGMMPVLTLALLENRISSAEILLKHGVDLNEMAVPGSDPQFNQCGSALQFSVRDGKLDAVKWLLAKGAKPDAADPVYGLTPLHDAAKSERTEALEMMKLLLDAGADPNRVSLDRPAPDSSDKTILLNASPLETAIASHSNALEKTKLMLEHKADPNRKDSRVSSMLVLAIGMDDPAAADLVQVLGEKGFRMSNPKLMESAISKGNPKLIGLLLHYGASPDSKDAEGNTLLVAACAAGDAERVELLLKHGADPKQPGLLIRLINRGPEAIPMIKILLEAGCDPNAVDSSKQPPVVELFDWNFENKNSGGVYLVSDKRSDQAKLLKLLLEHGLDPNTGYGEFQRMPANSRRMTRSGSSFCSPFLADTSESETVPRNLLMMVVEMSQRRRVNNVDMIGMLLDAGAKPASEFPEVFDFVAKGDESLSIAKALLPFRPKTLNLAAKGCFLNWNPQVKSLFLDEVLHPELAAKGGVHFVFANDSGGCEELVAPGAPIPDTALLLSRHLDQILSVCGGRTGKAQVPTLTLVRRESVDGWKRIPIHYTADDALPVLLSGDQIELAPGEESQLSTAGLAAPGSFSSESAFAQWVTWQIQKHVAFPVTLEADGGKREIHLRGDLLVFDPTKNEAPLLSAGRLARLFLYQSNDPVTNGVDPDAILTVRRKDGKETRMDLSASGAATFDLESGDHLMLPETRSIVERVEPQRRPVRLIAPGIAGERTFRPFSGSVTTDKPALAMPTLVQVLTDAYSNLAASESVSADAPVESSYPFLAAKVRVGLIPVILPHPDFSKIRIKRTFVEGKEEILEVDLAKAVAECRDDSPAVEARKADVVLYPGDVVELPVRADRAGQPWNGFSEAEERFFHKVLEGRLSIRKDDGIIETVGISYRQPDWQKTDHGLIPMPPRDGVSTSRLIDVTKLSNLVAGFPLKRDGKELPTGFNNPLVRDGDEIDLGRNSNSPREQPMPQSREPRPRVTPPPSVR